MVEKEQVGNSTVSSSTWVINSGVTIRSMVISKKVVIIRWMQISKAAWGDGGLSKSAYLFLFVLFD